MDALKSYNSVKKSGKPLFKVEDYIKFVKRIAKPFRQKIPSSLCVEDLIQVGLIALVEIRDKYDESLGNTFEQFASRRVKGAMIDLVRKNTPISKEKITVIKQAGKYIDSYIIKNGYRPKDSEIANYLEISLKKYQSIALEYESVFHYDIKEVCLFDTSLSLSEEALDNEHIKKILIKSLKKLTEREKKIIVLYYIEELTYSEIALIFSISESRVAQLMKVTLVKLREMIHASID